MEKQNFHYAIHAVFFFVYSLCGFGVYWYAAKDVGYSLGLFLMLVWNCSLSFLPLLFARQSLLSRRKQRHIWLLWALLWLLFWPNTFYMATDVAHFTGNSFYTVVPYQQPVYSTNLLLWAKGILIVSGILYGVLNGIKSEMLMEDNEIVPGGKGKRILFRAICSILGGAAIYIGRFLRLNSWDIFKPLKMITAFQRLGHDVGFILEFIAIFAAFIFAALSFSESMMGKDTAKL